MPYRRSGTAMRRRAMRGGSIRGWLKKGWDFVKANKLLSRGATAAAGILPQYAAPLAVVKRVAEAIGAGRRRRMGGALRLAGAGRRRRRYY